MDAFATSWSWPLSRLPPPPAFAPFPYDGAAPVMHTNPSSFGLDIALPPPAGATFCDPAHTLHGNPLGFDPIYGGADAHALSSNPFGFVPISGAAALHAVNSNPFSFGLGFPHPPFAGYYDPFYGGATAYTDVQYGNPFAVDCWDYTHTDPTYIDDYALPAIPAPDSPRTPVYGTSNPFNADNNAVFSMDVPAPWESLDLYNGHLQPAVEEPEPVYNNDTCKDSTAQLCASYGDDIEATLRAQEEDISTRPSPDYLDTTQGGRISPKMRTQLVCWMNGLCEHYDYELATATLHRAVSYTDRFLSSRALSDVTPHRLNLIGAAAVFAAAKYEDQGAVHKLRAAEIARHGGFADGQEVVDMERALMAALGYRLGGPTAHTFVEHFFARGYGNSKEEEESDELRCRARDLADVSLLSYGCLELKPSAVAAAAMFLATMTMLKPSYGQMKRWNKKLKEVTGYKPEDLEHGVEAIHSLVRKDDGNGNGYDIDIVPMFYADPD